MALDRSALGRRIVVRFTIGGAGPSGGPAMTDVIGRVLAVDECSVTVQRRDGRTQCVALNQVVTWKLVPDRPARSRRAAEVGVEELTRITSRGWPAIESEPLGEWELRASAGFTGRANSVAVHGDPGMPLAVALTHIIAFYAARGLPPLAQVVVGSAEDEAFATAGWVPMSGCRGGAAVQVADVEALHAPDPGARVAARADDEWLARYGRVDDPAIARVVLEGPPTVGFVSLDTPAVAIGRVVVSGEWAGLSCVEVEPPVRRQGLARRIVETSLAWATERGADKAYLQTMRSNEAAIALYAPYGFIDHHDYRYLQPPTPTSRWQ